MLGKGFMMKPKKTKRLKIYFWVVILVISIIYLLFIKPGPYYKELNYLLFDYENKLLKSADFVLETQINEIVKSESPKIRFELKNSRVLTAQEKEFITKNIYPLFKNMHYIAWDLCGMVGGRLNCYKVERKGQTVLFYFYDIRDKKGNIKLMFYKGQLRKDINKYKVKNIKEFWFYLY